MWCNPGAAAPCPTSGSQAGDWRCDAEPTELGKLLGSPMTRSGRGVSSSGSDERGEEPPARPLCSRCVNCASALSCAGSSPCVPCVEFCLPRPQRASVAPLWGCFVSRLWAAARHSTMCTTASGILGATTVQRQSVNSSSTLKRCTAFIAPTGFGELPAAVLARTARISVRRVASFSRAAENGLLIFTAKV